MNANDTIEKAISTGVKYFLVTFSVFDRDMRSVLVPASNTQQLLDEGTDVLGVQSFGIGPDAQKLKAFPDMSMMVQLPWDKEIAWVPCNLYLHGEPFKQCPRQVLASLMEKAKGMDLSFKTAVEVEFELLDEQGNGSNDHDQKELVGIMNPYFTMKYSVFIKQILSCLQDLGWKPIQASKEGRPNQFEINFTYDDALITADRHMFVKFMIKSLAQKDGFRASFMPYRTPVHLGNAMHLNFSLWDKAGKNLLPDPESSCRLSGLGQQALAGVLHNATDMCAVLCPTVNSYKKLHHWPNFGNMLSYAVENRMAMVRIPEDGTRLECRSPDGATNPYLLPAAVLAGILDGIQEKRELDSAWELTTTPPMGLGSPLLPGYQVLPRTLRDAVDAFASSKTMKSYLGAPLVGGYAFIKGMEYEEFLKTITAFEMASVDDY